MKSYNVEAHLNIKLSIIINHGSIINRGSMVKWYDLRLGCERSRDQIPAQSLLYHVDNRYCKKSFPSLANKNIHSKRGEAVCTCSRSPYL